jgi:hypothetical protein
MSRQPEGTGTELYVITGLVPVIPIYPKRGAAQIEMAGTSRAMT